MNRSFLKVGLGLALFVTACGGDSGSSAVLSEGDVDQQTSEAGEVDRATSEPNTADVSWFQPTVDSTWQWQLAGTIDRSYDVDTYQVDLFDTPESTISALHAEGRRVLCYFSAGSAEDWRVDYTDFDRAVLGEPLDGWEGEVWLDIRDAKVMEVMETRIALAQTKGCDGVDPDNVQGFELDSGFDLSSNDQIVFNLALAKAAHDRGLAIGLKNAADLIPALIDDFDYSVNEQCHQFEECQAYEQFISVGKPVFNAEYNNDYVNNADARKVLCSQAETQQFQTLVLPLELDASFRLPCDR